MRGRYVKNHLSQKLKNKLKADPIGKTKAKQENWNWTENQWMQMSTENSLLIKWKCNLSAERTMNCI